jgi:tRNA U34 5-carboxymethylaminomethyl modifying GTPase MnmE/TrmE
VSDTELEELVAHLVRSTRLSEAEAHRVIDEVLAFMSETPEDFVRRRHLELQAQGCTNAEIFARIAQELSQRRFSAPPLSERQIRRIIYG